MARQTGPIKYQGTLGDVRHFKIKNLPGHFAGMKGGPNGEQVKNAPEFARTRENMNEFGGCASAAKSIRVGLANLMKQMSDAQLTGRLTAIMKKINLEDQSEARGYRAILISTQTQYLKGLNFNRNISFDSIFYAPFNLAVNPARNGSVLSIREIAPSKMINAPAGATHYRLINALSVISDFAYNSNSGVYEPINTTLNELSYISYSDYLDLAKQTDDLTIENNLPGSPVMTDDVSVLNCLGIEFYQKVGANFYQFNTGNSLKVQNIF